MCISFENRNTTGICTDDKVFALFPITRYTCKTFNSFHIFFDFPHPFVCTRNEFSLVTFRFNFLQCYITSFTIYVLVDFSFLNTSNGMLNRIR